MAGADQISRALVRLKPEERALLALRFGRDLALPAVARIMDIPLGTAKSRLNRALLKVRQSLDQERPGGR